MHAPFPIRVAERVRLAAEAIGRSVAATWVFGSFSRDDANAASDVDVAVLCDPPLGWERARIADIVAREIGRDVDVVDLASAPPGLAWEIVTTGALAEELDSAITEAFVRRARFAVDDDLRRSRMILLAQTAPRGAA